MDAAPCRREAEVHAGGRAGPAALPEGAAGVPANRGLQKLRPAAATAARPAAAALAAAAAASDASCPPATVTGSTDDAATVSLDQLTDAFILFSRYSSSRQHTHLTAKSNLSSTFNKFRRTTHSCILYSTCNSLGNNNNTNSSSNSNSSMVIEVIMLLVVTEPIVQGTKLARLTFPSSPKSFSTTIKVRRTNITDYYCNSESNLN